METSSNAQEVTLIAKFPLANEWELELVPCDLCGADASCELYVPPRGWRLVRCSHCPLAYLNPRPTQKAISAAYNDSRYFEEISPFEEQRFRRAFSTCFQSMECPPDACSKLDAPRDSSCLPPSSAGSIHPELTSVNRRLMPRSMPALIRGSRHLSPPTSSPARWMRL